MNEIFAAAMRRATGQARASKALEATHTIQSALALGSLSRDARARDERGRDQELEPIDITPPRREGPAARLLSERQSPDPGGAEPHEPNHSPQPEHPEPGPQGGQRFSGRSRRALGDVFATLREGRGRLPGSLPGVTARARKAPPPIPAGARFQSQTFACAPGARDYKLYIPASMAGTPRALIIMLHGCRQDADDFAIGTGMNTLAEKHRLIVAYPEQSSADNPASCWNWFNPEHQRRDAGEPAILAGLTRQLASEFGIGRQRIFVAGLSAGGAMAAILADTYPDLYAAAGIHSGLASGSANDVVSAFAAMRGGENPESALGGRHTAGASRLIVFQGMADRTVHHSNAERIISSRRAGITVQSEIRRAGGRRCRRDVYRDSSAAIHTECWMIDGSGHAWSGGDPSGSYTECGPDASAEMVRFFLE